MSDRKNNFEKFVAIQPKHTFIGPVMDERGNKDLPPGKKGGEKMRPDLHEIHKQHTFDSFCKKVLKHEAGNGHREINRRIRIEISMSDLPEEAMEQLAVYDDYPWDYTPFQVGDETVLVKDDRLAEALLLFPKRNAISSLCIGSWIWPTVILPITRESQGERSTRIGREPIGC